MGGKRIAVCCGFFVLFWAWGWSPAAACAIVEEGRLVRRNVGQVLGEFGGELVCLVRSGAVSALMDRFLWTGSMLVGWGGLLVRSHED